MKSQEEPVISVVVPTRDRAHRLQALVAALSNQDLGLPYEVIFVDDASTDDTVSELSRLAVASRVPLGVLSLPVHAGPAAARNLGWLHAKAPLIAFTDDDCAPQPGWLRALVSALRDNDFAQGRTRPAPDDTGPLGPFDRTVSVGGENGFYETCNMGYRRALLERLGGFDEGFRRAAGEDTDLGCRARTIDTRFTFVPTAVVHHDIVRPGVAGYLRNTRRWAGVVRVVRLHPEMKRFFSRGPFWLMSHNLAILAGLGITSALVLISVTPAAAAALMLCLPYVWYRPRLQPPHQGRATRSISLAGVFLGDLAEAGVHVVSMLRFRPPRLVPRTTAGESPRAPLSMDEGSSR